MTDCCCDTELLIFVLTEFRSILWVFRLLAVQEDGFSNLLAEKADHKSCLTPACALQHELVMYFAKSVSELHSTNFWFAVRN